MGRTVEGCMIILYFFAAGRKTVLRARAAATRALWGGDEDVDLLFSVVPAPEELFYPVYPLRIHG